MLFLDPWSGAVENLPLISIKTWQTKAHMASLGNLAITQTILASLQKAPSKIKLFVI